MVNTSISGNTIGFDGQGKKRLNSVDQLTVYLRRGFAEMGGVDEIIIALGTNDCKAEYRPNTEEREKYYVTLLDNIERFFKERGQEIPRIVLLSPPPMGPEDRLSTTFKGGSECVASFTEYLGELAARRGLCFSDLSKTQRDLLQYSEDGVHFDVTGYELIARKLIQDCY